MKKFERLDEATTPDGSVLTLYRHDGAYQIRLDGVELMSTRHHHSEEELAQRVCARLRHVANPRVLIGGLGLGFTLRAALHTLGNDARILVVELVEAVIRWNEDPAYDLAGPALRDPRVTTQHDDVSHVLETNPGAFDGIILDVDNGAEALTTAHNARLYRDDGIRITAAALRPGGCVAYWSAVADPGFATDLRRAGLTVDVLTVRTRGRVGTRHTLYVARRAAADP